MLVPAAGAGLGIAGAGIALCGAYVVMLCVMHLLTRALFSVGFEWLRLAMLGATLAGVAVSGELLLPTHGLGGLLLRVAWLALIPAILLATRFFRPPSALRRALLGQGVAGPWLPRGAAATSSCRRGPARGTSEPSALSGSLAARPRGCIPPRASRSPCPRSG